MRVRFKDQYKELLRAKRSVIRKSANAANREKNIIIDGRYYKVNSTAQNICKVEMICSFLIEQTDKKNITVKDVLNLFRFVTNSDIPYFDNLDKRKAAKLQNMISSCTYKGTVERMLEEYSKYPGEWCILNSKEQEDNSISLSKKEDIRTNKKIIEYNKALDNSLRYVETSRSFNNDFNNEIFDNKIIYYTDFKDNEEKSVYLSESLLEYAKTSYEPDVLNTDPVEQSPVTVNLNKVKTWAQEMDKKDKKLDNSNNWVDRVRDLIFSIPENNNLKDCKKIKVNGILHSVGALSVGKSTFINVCSYGLANEGKRIAIFLNTVSDVQKTVDYLYSIGISAVPLLSVNQIKKHKNKYLSSLKTHNELFNKKRCQRYISDSCMLLNCNMKIEDGINDEYPPCNGLYVKKNEGNENSDKENIICPFVSVCPRYNSIRDLDDANVIVTTMNSSVQSKLPAPYCNKRMTILEYILRTCHLAFIDESDQVQAALDSMFHQEISIFGDKNIFYRKTANRAREYYENGDIPENQHIQAFIAGTRNIETFTDNITGFLRNTKNIDNLFSKKLFGEMIKSQMLWRDLFDQAIRVTHKKQEHNDKEFKEQYRLARHYFENTFAKFRNSHIRGIRPNSQEDISYHLRGIASNIADNPKLLFDLQNFSQKKLSELLTAENGKLKKQDFNKLPGLYQSWDKQLCSVVDRVVEKLKLIMDMYMLEYHIKYVLEKWELISRINGKWVDHTKGYSGKLRREFAGIVPALPIDLSFGFKIVENKNGTMKIKYLTFEGIGRWIILNFDKLYRDLDGVTINCILLSGTSNMKDSPKYSIDLPVGCLLRKKNAKVPKISINFPSSLTTKISGVKYTGRSLQELADNLFDKSMDPEGKGFLPSVISKLPEGRKRVLFSVGSYDESKIFSEYLDEHMEKAYTLVRSGETGRNDLIQNEIVRNKIEDIAGLDVKSIAMPMAIGRGYNIVTEVMDYMNESESNEFKTIAAIGAAFLVKRPFYIPGDINVMVAWLNSVYIRAMNDYKQNNAGINEYQKELIKKLYATQYNFESMYGYESLSKYQRKRLLGDMIVDVYQLACRLIRGEVDAQIFCLDSSYAPKTVMNENDAENTSMLIGWRNMMDRMINKPENDVDGLINKELYQMLLDGLKKVKLNER